MQLKITTGKYWYSSEVGNVFNIIDLGDGYYVVDHPTNTDEERRIIDFDDCVVLNSLASDLNEVYVSLGNLLQRLKQMKL